MVIQLEADQIWRGDYFDSLEFTEKFLDIFDAIETEATEIPGGNGYIFNDSIKLVNNKMVILKRESDPYHDHGGDISFHVLNQVEIDKAKERLADTIKKFGDTIVVLKGEIIDAMNRGDNFEQSTGSKRDHESLGEDVYQQLKALAKKYDELVREGSTIENNRVSGGSRYYIGYRTEYDMDEESEAINKALGGLYYN